LPGKGDLQERLGKYREQFKIPTSKLDAVYSAAVNECRARTQKLTSLPKGENFKVEFVSGKTWSAYNWYKGKLFSVIQINTDIPSFGDDPIALASHEGYPGHHLSNIIFEDQLLKKKKWIEFSIFPLFSPMSLISEGVADYAATVLFTPIEKEEFLRKTIFQIAELDKSKAHEYLEITEITDDLETALVDVARDFLDKKISKEIAIKRLMDQSLLTKSRAEKKLAFIEQYRSYIITYSIGKKMVENYVLKASTKKEKDDRFLHLFNHAVTPANLAM
jgi:hypothetical protein